MAFMNCGMQGDIGRTPQLVEAQAGLREASLQLRDLGAKLEDRLGPVLRPVLHEQEPNRCMAIPTPPVQAMAPAAEAIEQVATEMRYTIDRLNDILNRLEV